MAKIIYGVSGEGSGHSSRARLIGQWLVEQGHQIKIVSYDRGYRNLKDEFDTLEIVGLSISNENNEVSKIKTITENLAKLPDGSRAYKKLKSCFKEFQPDVVITDFEPCTAYLATKYKLPLISLDNQHRMRYMEFSIPPGMNKEAALTKTIVRALVPKPWVSLITTFHDGTPTNSRTFIFPPILRKEVLQLEATDGDHILVYSTAGFPKLLDTLSHFKRESFIIYGLEPRENIAKFQFKPFSKEGFLQDLASAKAVIATSGFTLITESLYLAKPYLALPMAGQYEQCLNAHMLTKMGYGEQCTTQSESAIAAFLYKIVDYKSTLKQYPRNGNEAIQSKLGDLLANNLAELQKYRR